MRQTERMINGNLVNVTTAFDDTIEYIPTREEARQVKTEVWDLLEEYFPGLLNSGYGIDTMFSTDGDFWGAKGWLIDAFQKSPFYNGNYQIVLKDIDMCRHINMKDVKDFFRYACSQLKEEGSIHVLDGKKMSDEEYEKLLEKQDHADRLRRHFSYVSFSYKYTKRASKLLAKYTDMLDAMETEFYREREIRCLNVISYFIRQNGVHLCDDALARELNKIIPELKAVPGQKISRLVQRICKRTEIVKHTDIQDESFVRQDGEVVTRMKDFGWNYQYARFSDAINPITLKGTMVISVNPIDFYTMSFGKNWASCHTIDKENRRGVTSHNYSGCYCGGTESYMLDGSSFVVYYLSDNFNGDHPEKEDKIKRCMFFLGEDKLIQSRVYPDGRDGGDASLAGDMRATVQKIIAELWNVPNYWENKKGTDACSSVIYSDGVQYRDYECYDDCNVSYLKRIDGYKNEFRINVGVDPICPECGECHEESENIFCDDCKDVHICPECGCRMAEDDSYYVEDEHEYYCRDCVTSCERCGYWVRINGSRETSNGNICRHCSDRYYTYSDYEECYISNNEVVISEEGNAYGPDSDGYFVCDRCEQVHDARVMIRIRMLHNEEECVCPECAE